MTDRLEAMSILVAVADAGSLSAGARALRMPLASVSRKVAALEAELGVQLVHRSARGLRPTEAGASYLTAARKILEEVEEAEQLVTSVAHTPRGTLSLTTPLVFGRLHMVPVVLEFLAAHPLVNVRLEQTDRVVSLSDERLDVALRIGALPDSELVARRLGVTRRVVCASPEHLARCGPLEGLDALATRGCVTFGEVMGATQWRFAQGEGRGEVSVPVRSRLEVSTAEAAIAAAEAGLGPTRVLSYQIADAVRAGRLVVVLAEHEPAPWPISLVHTARAHMPQKLRAFLDFATPRLTRALAGLP